MATQKQVRSRASAKAQVCEKCGGSGYELTEQGARPCECSRAIELMRAWNLARIPKKFLGKSLETFSCKSPSLRPIAKGARDFVMTFRTMDDQHPAKGLWLAGKEGTGKTHIAVSVLKEVIAQGSTGLYWNVPELFLELRRLMSDNAQITEAELFDQALRVDLLVLDDLGAEKTSEYVIDRLYVLINGRYQNDNATIITTNRSPDELRAQMNPRIVSRLCEMCVQMDFPDGDYRRLNMK